MQYCLLMKDMTFMPSSTRKKTNHKVFLLTVQHFPNSFKQNNNQAANCVSFILFASHKAFLYMKMRGVFHLPDVCATGQKDFDRLEKSADGHNKGKIQLLNTGRNYQHQYRLGAYPRIQIHNGGQ